MNNPLSNMVDHVEEYRDYLDGISDTINNALQSFTSVIKRHK